MLFEREPGAEFVRRPPVREANSFDDIALAVGPQGAAAVAWQSGGPGGQVFAMLRDRSAAFGAPVLVRRDELRPSSTGLVSVGLVDDSDGPPLRGSDAPARGCWARTGARCWPGGRRASVRGPRPSARPA